MPNGVNLVTGIPFEIEKYVSEYSIAQPILKVIGSHYRLSFSHSLLLNIVYFIHLGTSRNSFDSQKG